MVEREPCLPLRIGDTDTLAQGLAKRREFSGQIRIFVEDRLGRKRFRIRAGHVADKMHHRVAQLDVDIQFFERDAAKILKILLDLDFDIVAREIAAKLIAISAEFIRHRRQKYPDRLGHLLPLP